MEKDTLLSDAQAVAEIFDLKYNEADFATKITMKPARDSVFEELTFSRFKIMEPSVVVTSAHIAEMNDLRSGINNAADKQSFIATATKLVGLLRRIVV